MSGAKSKEKRGFSRRAVLAGAGAVALGSGLGLRSLAAQDGLRWDEGDPAFEVRRRLHVGQALQGPVSVRFHVDTPRGTHSLGEIRVQPGESAEITLEYPFQEIVAGRYVYRAEGWDSEGRVLRSETLEVTLREYRFGC